VKIQEELDIDVLVHGEPEVWSWYLLPNHWLNGGFFLVCKYGPKNFLVIIFVNSEERHGWVLRRTIIWLCFHSQWVGAILRISLRQTTHYLWWREPSQANDCLLVFNCSKFDQTANEGNAYWPCYYSELVLC
jgi:hypothetical protein